MKKVCLFLFALLICMTLTVPAFAAEVPLLYDGADLLSLGEERDILSQLEEVRDKYQVEIAIATVETTEGYDVDRYVEIYYDRNDIGIGTNRNGVLLLISMEERDWRILSNGLCADAITLGEIDAIGEEIVGQLSSGDYAEAFVEFIDLCSYEINGEINGFPFDFGKNLLISLAIGFAVALVATLIMAAQLRSVRRRTEAGEYTAPGSMHVTHSSDLFLYRTVSRRARPKESSGSRSGGGGGRNVGGGKF